MTNDLISNMLSKLQNASLAKHTFLSIPYSNVNFSILKILFKQGYIKDIQILNIEYRKKEIKVFLKYSGWWLKKPMFSIIKRISKPGKRIFSSYKNLEKNLVYLKLVQGIAIISTSAGIMTHIKAKKLKKGGEILCYIE